jgi:hypothetical protein
MCLIDAAFLEASVAQGFCMTGFICFDCQRNQVESSRLFLNSLQSSFCYCVYHCDFRIFDVSPRESRAFGDGNGCLNLDSRIVLHRSNTFPIQGGITLMANRI